MSEHALSTQTRAAQILKAALLEVTDDKDAIADTIEGETTLHEAIASVMDGITEDEMMVAGIRAMLEQLVNRRIRIEARIERRRAAIERGMAAGELPKLELPNATLSLRRVPPALKIEDETKVPSKYWKPQDPKLDRAAVLADLKSETDVPGCYLDNGGQTLSIRRA